MLSLLKAAIRVKAVSSVLKEFDIPTYAEYLKRKQRFRINTGQQLRKNNRTNQFI